MYPLDEIAASLGMICYRFINILFLKCNICFA